MTTSYRKVAQQYLSQTCRQAARELQLEHWGLEGLASGQPVTLYHGTTSSFQKFDMQKSRTELVDKYYGAGIFLTPRKKIAWEYAYSNRNIGFDPSFIDDLRAVNRKAANVLQLMYDHGRDVWDMWTREALGLAPEDVYSEAMEEMAGGVDLNLLQDISFWIIGTKMKEAEREDGDGLGGGGGLDLFNQSIAWPDFSADLDKIGMDSAKYRPKVYTVSVVVENTLVTANRTQARNAKKKGYDCVVFHGADLVGQVPEVAVFNPHKVRITHVEVGD